MSFPGCILLVEDDPDDVFLLQYAFDKAELNCPVSIVDDGQKALDYLAGTGDYADRKRFPLAGLILLDLKLPVLPGMEVLKHITRSPVLSSIPVVVLTSSRNPEDIAESYLLGAQGFFVKPISNEQRERVARIIKENWVEGKPHQRIGPGEQRSSDTELIVFLGARA
jgi:CheY-like chemotaxis protein